jgi:hypothetical protein
MGLGKVHCMSSCCSLVVALSLIMVGVASVCCWRCFGVCIGWNTCGIVCALMINPIHASSATENSVLRPLGYL